MGLPSMETRKELFSPWEDLSEIGKQMDAWVASMRSGLPALNNGVALASVDVEDKGDRWLVQADLPGMKKEHIQVRLEGNELLIEAQREEKSEERKKSYVRSERYSGSVRRSVELPGRLHADPAKAAYADGVLKVEIPKDVEKGPATSRIDVQ